MFSSSRKRGNADDFENDPPFMSKCTVLCVYIQPCVYTAVDLINLDLQLYCAVLNVCTTVEPRCMYRLFTRAGDASGIVTLV